MTEHDPTGPAEVPRSSGTPFYLACVALVVGSAAVAAGTKSSPVGMVAFLAGLTGAMVFFILPSWLEHRAQVLEQLNVALAELERRTYDLESVRREHRRSLARVEEVHEQSARVAETLQEQARDLGDLFRLKEELVEVRQDRQRLQKALEERDRALMDHSDSQIRLLSQEGLGEEYREAAARGLEHLHRMMAAQGLDPVFPGPGDPFEDRLHQAVETAPGTDDVPDHHVLACLRAGYRRGDVLLRRAEVRLAAAPHTQEVPA